MHLQNRATSFSGSPFAQPKNDLVNEAPYLGISLSSSVPQFPLSITNSHLLSTFGERWIRKGIYSWKGQIYEKNEYLGLSKENLSQVGSKSLENLLKEANSQCPLQT